MPADVWAAEAERLRQQVADAERAAATRAAADAFAAQHPGEGVARPKRPAPLPEGYMRVVHKIMLQRRSYDLGRPVYDRLETYTGPHVLDTVKFDLANRFCNLCPHQWWCDDCRFRLHNGVDPTGQQSFSRPAFAWTPSRTGRQIQKEISHPLLVSTNLYRWNEIGGVQENGK